MSSAGMRLNAIEKQMRKNRNRQAVHRLLFLDFDGVVNVPYEYGTPEYDAAMDAGVYDFFRPEIVVRLNRLIHDYDLHVVISSSWRYSGIEFCQRSLQNAGFSPDVMIEGTTALSEGIPPRYEEILDYLESHPDVSEFLILDDIPMHALSPYAVQTVFEEGYTEKADQNGRRILDRQIKDSQRHPMFLWLIVMIAVIIFAALALILQGMNQS